MDYLKTLKLLQTQFVSYLIFMKTEIKPRLKDQYASTQLHNIVGLFFRALLWGEALEKLDSAKFFQTHASGTRSIMEISVDVLLLKKADVDTTQKYQVWKESAALNHASGVVNYYRNKVKMPIPDQLKRVAKYHDDNVERIKNNRKATWGKTQHPQRWTDQSLEEDCRRVDELYPIFVEKYLSSKMLEVYDVEYRRLLWKVHGSSLVGMEGAEPKAFNAACVVALYLSCGFIGITIDAVIHSFEWEDLIKLWDERHLRLVDFLNRHGVDLSNELGGHSQESEENEEDDDGTP